MLTAEQITNILESEYLLETAPSIDEKNGIYTYLV